MRTIGLFLLGCLLATRCAHHPAPAGRQNAPTGFKIPQANFSVPAASPQNGQTDTNALKQSNWYANAIRSIEESEYEIKQADNSHLFTSPNRQQNLRAYYTADKFTLEPRTDDNWKLELTVKGVYSGKKKIYSPAQDAMAVTNKNNIQFNHHNEFTVEYINSKEGVRQNFIIQKPQADQPQTINLKLQTNKGWFINQVHPTEIHFAKVQGETIDKKITYNDLKVWDVNHKELEASFSVTEKEISINVTTADAVYPITIDPLGTGTSGTPDSTPNNADQTDAYLGMSVASAGDVDGDGYSDVVIGVPGYDNDGRAYVYHGSATGLSSTINTTLDVANQAGAQFGISVASAGDVNKDGYSDVIIGAYLFDETGTNEGRAFVHYGSPTGLSVSANVTLDGTDQADAYFGCSVACAGDVNGDGFSDVIVGAYGFDEDGNNEEGRAFVYHGSSTGLNTTAASTPDDANEADARFGVCVASAGDVDGDGYSDVIIGAYLKDDGLSNEGMVYVYRGGASGLTDGPGFTLDDADQANALFGLSVASAGDVNGDGYSDVIVGASGCDDGGNTAEGRAFVYYGSSSGLPATPDITLNDADQAAASYGFSVACAGDVNGDGYSDVIIGANGYDDGGNPDEGLAFVYFGSSTGLSVAANSLPNDADQASAQFGQSVASAGDINGDGFSDIIIGAPYYNDSPYTDEGWAFVYHGSPDGLSSNYVYTADDCNLENSNFGMSLACAGDVNGDGFSDVIIGAPFYDGTYPNEGRTFLYLGSATGLAASYAIVLSDVSENSALFGMSVACAGDVNGDGLSDVIIGAPYADDGGSSNEGKAFVYFGENSSNGISATADVTLDDADTSNSLLGRSVAGAGDINHDGYADVIVGAHQRIGSIASIEGAALIYYGSSAGPNGSPVILEESDQIGSEYGYTVCGAGDVDGDGYSDVAVAATSYNDNYADEGVVYIYHGSATGILTPATTILDNGDQATLFFGRGLSSAGDVNGDGYGDLIVGAYQYDAGNINEGRAFVYHGSSTGINITPDTTLDDANEDNAFFGQCVAGAGDVNGDGYSDVIVGALGKDDGIYTGEGLAYVYYGSPAGISSTPGSIPDDANETGAQFGQAVAGAGDVNGDGYSDVIIGAPLKDDVFSNEGLAYVYYGNGNGGLRNNLRLYNTDLITPLSQANMGDPNLFGAGLYAKSFLGRQKGKLVWETVKNGNPFSETPITNSTLYTAQASGGYTDLALTGTELKSRVAKVATAFATYIRTRVKYDPVTAITGQVYGPWRYPEAYLRGRRDIGSVALPLRFLAFTAAKENDKVRLQWITANEPPGILYFIEHSTDGVQYSTAGTMASAQLPHNQYSWLHEHPQKGINYYRLRALSPREEKYSDVRIIHFALQGGFRFFPTVAGSGQLLTIETGGAPGEKAVLTLLNAAGQPVWQQEVAGGRLQFTVPKLPVGFYLLRVQQGSRTETGKLLLQ